MSRRRQNRRRFRLRSTWIMETVFPLQCRQ